MTPAGVTGLHLIRFSINMCPLRFSVIATGIRDYRRCRLKRRRRFGGKCQDRSPRIPRGSRPCAGIYSSDNSKSPDEWRQDRLLLLKDRINLAQLFCFAVLGYCGYPKGASGQQATSNHFQSTFVIYSSCPKIWGGVSK